MVDSDEEFEPLFDYSRIQPIKVICFDDDLDESPVFCSKKQKLLDTAGGKKAGDVKVDVKVVELDDKEEEEEEEEEEEDWLAPPPKILDNRCKALKEDSTLMALRLKKQELASIAQSAEEVVRAVEESVRKDLNAASQSSTTSEPLLQAGPPRERTKLVISIQDKDGFKQFRVFVDDKFERLFKMYADRTKLDVKRLVFSFDGDKVNPSQTPETLGMEENDIIEVHVKSS